MEDPVKDIKKEDLLKPLEGEKLEEYKALEDCLTMKQAKTSRATIKGLLKVKKTTDMRRLYKNSKNPESQQKYNQWQNDVKRMEEELTRFNKTFEFHPTHLLNSVNTFVQNETVFLCKVDAQLIA